MVGEALNILLAEDSIADVKITQRAFKKAGFENNLIVTTDGQETLDYVFKRGIYDNPEVPTVRPDLILLDINMPKMSGFEVLSSLKESEEFSMIPIVMLTSSKDISDIQRSYKGGASSYIQKPVTYEAFEEVVDCFSRYWGQVIQLPAHQKLL